MDWLILIISLPTENRSARMRAWRALKASGAAALRDGVYLLPEAAQRRATLAAVADDVRANGGSAHLLVGSGQEADRFPALFDREAAFDELLAEVRRHRARLAPEHALDAARQVRRLRRAFEQLAATDFFPGQAQRQTKAALDEFESAAARALAPDEPQPAAGRIARRDAADYQQRTWATRRRPWVDRLACAWLIRRHVDPAARFLWLDSPSDCPPDALGFDFDGAPFTHVGERVTFETLLASFGLDAPALQRVGALVRFLDAGGVPTPEAAGVERVLAGLRDTIDDDDRLLASANLVFDGLLAAFEKEAHR